MTRENRQASNRELFRAVNDRIADLAIGFDQEAYPFICECSLLGCTEQIEVPLKVYTEAVATPDAYLVLTGHQAEDENVIADYEVYLIVRLPASS